VVAGKAMAVRQWLLNTARVQPMGRRVAAVKVAQGQVAEFWRREGRQSCGNREGAAGSGGMCRTGVRAVVAAKEQENVAGRW